MFEKIKQKRTEKRFERSVQRTVQNYEEMNKLLAIQIVQINQASEAIDKITEKYFEIMNEH